MSAIEIAPGVTIPDAITPESGWRVWRTDRKHGHLCPVHITTAPWNGRAPMRASCHAHRQPPRAWLPVSLDEAIERGETTHRDWFRRRRVRDDIGVRPPRTFLPETMAYVWREIADVHAPPEKDCTCGIYATSSIDGCADQLRHGSVIGRVSLWGKMIPGEKGWRAQFAYPTELYVVAGDRCAPPTNSIVWTFNLTARDNEAALAGGDAIALADRLAEYYAVPCSVIEDWTMLR